MSQIEPLACSPYELHIYQESLERGEILCWSPRRALNENEAFCFPWATAEDLRIGALEVRRLLKVLVSWNVNKSLAKFTANLLYRVARTLSVLLKAKIVNSSANSRWQAIIGCSLLPTIFHSPRPSPQEPYSFQKYVSWMDTFNFLKFPPNCGLVVKAYMFSKAIFQDNHFRRHYSARVPVQLFLIL